MAIYSRDNFAPALQSALDSALRRRDEYVKRDAARRDANVKAITDMMKVAGRAAESTSEQEDKLKKLEEERNAILKAQEDANKAVLDANERSLNASQAMQDYRPNSVLAVPDKETSAYQAAMMEGYRPVVDPGASSSAIMQGYKPADSHNPAFYKYDYQNKVTENNPRYDYLSEMNKAYSGQGQPLSAMQDWYKRKGLEHLLAMQNYGKGVY